jgi:hypothetical protein
MIQKLRAEWNAGMSFTDLIELRDSLDSILHDIRFTCQLPFVTAEDGRAPSQNHVCAR